MGAQAHRAFLFTIARRPAMIAHHLQRLALILAASLIAGLAFDAPVTAASAVRVPLAHHIVQTDVQTREMERAIASHLPVMQSRSDDLVESQHQE
jgi:hypothetical protein